MLNVSPPSRGRSWRLRPVFAAPMAFAGCSGTAPEPPAASAAEGSTSTGRVSSDTIASSAASPGGADTGREPGGQPGSSSGEATTTNDDGLQTTTGGESADGPPVFGLALGADSLPYCFSTGLLGPGPAWADVNGDGWLDLFAVGGECPSTLALNDGAGNLVPEPLILPGSGTTIGAAFGDYDNDGWPDLYVMREGTGMLLRNDSGQFWDVTEGSGAIGPALSYSATWADFDRDGNLDLYVADATSAMGALLHNDGDGTFTDISTAVATPGIRPTNAATWFDFDDDMDLYLAIDKEIGNHHGATTVRVAGDGASWTSQRRPVRRSSQTRWGSPSRISTETVIST